jgi:hypothetical protein
MFNVWGLTNLRPTRDIDLLGHTQNTVDAVLKIFQDLSKLEAEPDGLEFDPVHIQGETIKEDAEYEGIRITMLWFSHYRLTKSSYCTRNTRTARFPP